MSGPGPGEVDLEALGDRVLSMVPGRADATVVVSRVCDGLTRFANSFIHQNVLDEHVSVALELVKDGRPAAVSTRAVDDDSLRRTIDSALGAAAIRPPDPSWAGLCPPTASTGHQVHYDRATAEAGADDRARVVADFVEAGEGLESAGYCQSSVREARLANSAGHRISDAWTEAAVDGIQRQGRSDGCGSRASFRLGDIDGAAAGSLAAGRARAGADPIELAAGRYEVILDPRCVAYIMDFLSVYGFNARAVAEGRSFASMGEAQFDPALSVWDDALDARHLGSAFDSEGTPKRHLALVQDGVTVGVTQDRRTAAKWPGSQSTGHAVPGGASTGALATNLFLGSSGPPTGAAALVSGVARGLLVHDFWYTRVLDPRTLVVTGLTRNGVFLIENGQVGPAVSNLRFTQSPVAALAPGHVLGVGDDGALAPGGLHLGWNHAPTLRLAQWSFTGNASG
jgi:predicted Zn-dependent protease